MADRLAAARRGHFVGRVTEFGLFRSALLEAEPAPAVLHIHGPGVVGKTTLLRELARIAAELGRPAVRLDGRHIEPSPTGLLRALWQASGRAGESPALAMAETPHDGVLLIDT